MGKGGEESDTLGKEGGRDMSGTQKQHAKRRLWFRGVSREKVRKNQGAEGRGRKSAHTTGACTGLAPPCSGLRVFLSPLHRGHPTSLAGHLGWSSASLDLAMSFILRDS